jgi:hypothetical protein
MPCCLLNIFFLLPILTAQSDITGLWIVSVSMPEGPFPLEIEFGRNGGTEVRALLLTAQGKAPVSRVNYQNSKISVDLIHSGRLYRFDGIVVGSKARGTWMEPGTSNKGTWTAARELAQSNTNSEMLGSWDLRARILDREIPFLLDLRQEDGHLLGMLRSSVVSAPIEKASLHNGQLGFAVELFGNQYRVQAAMKDGVLVGQWRASGPVRAVRKIPDPAPDPVMQNLEGEWRITASTGTDSRQQQMILRAANGTIGGTIGLPGRFVVIRNVLFKSNRLTFEADDNGGAVRIEADFAAGKLQGRWVRIGAQQSGAWVAERR